MACCLSGEEKAALARNAEIDKELKAAKINLSREIKLLLLGTPNHYHGL